MSPAFRAVRVATITAFCSAFAVGAVVYGVLFAPYASMGLVFAIALGGGCVAAMAVFAAVWALVRSRYPGKRPVIGALRGAVIGVCVLMFVAAGHGMLSGRSGGVLYSMYGNVFHASWMFGWFAAATGGICGRYIERICFSSGGNQPCHHEPQRTQPPA